MIVGYSFVMTMIKTLLFDTFWQACFRVRVRATVRVRVRVRVRARVKIRVRVRLGTFQQACCRARSIIKPCS